MVWERYIEMAEWPYPLQEVFKGATILWMLLACLMLWRRWSSKRRPLSFGSITCLLSLALVACMEFVAAVLRLWPYFFGFPHDPMLLRRIYGSGMPLIVVALCAGILGLIGKERIRWWVLLLSLVLFFQWMMFISGEPALVISGLRFLYYPGDPPSAITYIRVSPYRQISNPVHGAPAHLD